MEGFLAFPSFLPELQSNPLSSLSFEPQICETSFMGRHAYACKICTHLRKKSSHHTFENPKLQTLGLIFQGKKRIFFLRCISSSSFWDPFNELEMTMVHEMLVAQIMRNFQSCCPRESYISVDKWLQLSPLGWPLPCVLSIRPSFKRPHCSSAPTHRVSCHDAKTQSQQRQSGMVPGPGSIYSPLSWESKQLNVQTHLWFMQCTLWSLKLNNKQVEIMLVDVASLKDLYTSLNNSEGGLSYRWVQIYRLLMPLQQDNSLFIWSDYNDGLFSLESFIAMN